MTLLIPVLLILAGLVLVVVEVYFVPGFNVIGVAGVIAAGAGVGYAFVTGGALGGFIALTATLGAGGALLALMWRIGAWERFILYESLTPGDASDTAASRGRLLGREGMALSPLRPTGVAEIEGERVEVTTEGAFIAAGSRIRVVALVRGRYLVRLAEGA